MDDPQNLRWLRACKVKKKIPVMHVFHGRSDGLYWFGEVGSDVGQINEVALRWARLVLEWVLSLIHI